MSLSNALTLSILSFIITAIFAPLLIQLLYKFKFVVTHRLLPDKTNKEFLRIQGHKSGTPNMGGLMIAFSVFLVVLFFFPAAPLKNLFLIGWVIFTGYGFIDGSLADLKRVSDRFKQLEASFTWRVGKLILLYLLNLLMLYLITTTLNISTVDFFGLFDIAVNNLSIFIGSFLMSLAMYGMEITDGADGLVTGKFLTLFVE